MQFQANPAATASAGVGFGENKGSIQYVNLSDVKSGKVKLPTGGTGGSGTEDAPQVIPPLPKESKGFGAKPTEFI